MTITFLVQTWVLRLTQHLIMMNSYAKLFQILCMQEEEHAHFLPLTLRVTLTFEIQT